jgi:hypothetical protein
MAIELTAVEPIRNVPFAARHTDPAAPAAIMDDVIQHATATIASVYQRGSIYSRVLFSLMVVAAAVYGFRVGLHVIGPDVRRLLGT